MGPDCMLTWRAFSISFSAPLGALSVSIHSSSFFLRFLHFAQVIILIFYPLFLLILFILCLAHPAWSSFCLFSCILFGYLVFFVLCRVFSLSRCFSISPALCAVVFPFCLVCLLLA